MVCARERESSKEGEKNPYRSFILLVVTIHARDKMSSMASVIIITTAIIIMMMLMREWNRQSEIDDYANHRQQIIISSLFDFYFY